MKVTKKRNDETIEELYASLGLKIIPQSARKHPNEDSVQIIRRLRSKIDSGNFTF